MNLAQSFNPAPKPTHKRKSTRSKEFSPKIRDIVRERSGGKCELCYMRPIVDFHHAVYKSQLGTGRLENCIGLCKVCHNVIHHDGEASKYFRDMCEERAPKLAAEWNAKHLAGVEEHEVSNGMPLSTERTVYAPRT